MTRDTRPLPRARALAVLALCLACAATAGAQVPARMVVEGGCPTREELRQALQGLVVDPTAHAWELQVRPDDGGAVLELFDAAGRLTLRRRLRHSDCRELAEGFAVIVHAHLLDLRLVDENARVRAAAAEPEGEDEEPGAARTGSPPPPPAPAADPPVTPSGARLALAVGGVGGATATPKGFFGGGGLDLEWSPAADGLALRLEAHGYRHTEQQGEAGAVVLKALRVGISALLRVSLGGSWVAPGIGAGVSALWVEARELSGQPSVRRAHPLVSSGIEVGTYWLGRGFVRFALRMDVAPQGDRYRVEPIGTVAFSPRWLVYGTLALGIDFPL